MSAKSNFRVNYELRCDIWQEVGMTYVQLSFSHTADYPDQTDPLHSLSVRPSVHQQRCQQQPRPQVPQSQTHS